MTVSSDLSLIESRIVDAVRRFMSMEAGQEIAPSCRMLADAVSRQAVASSEGGKRLRARLVLDAFDAVDRRHHDTPGYRESVLDLACAIELFQTAALVHDDIIDESDLRRGKPSAHKALASAAHNATIGKGLGIMLGDLLATASVDLANQAARGLVSSDAIVTSFLAMHREVEIGQVLDLAVELNPLDDPQRLVQASLNVFRWKTASYTTIAPLRFALLAAGADPGVADRHAMAIGLPLGQAFQLADDLLDVIGSSRNTGKPIGSDIREGKRTVLLADAIAAADESQRTTLIDLFEATARDDADVRQAIALFEATGAIDRSRRRIRTLWDRAHAAIGELRLPADVEGTLVEACRRFVPTVEA
ncbi:polyprenyl synthetase family protein [Bifidobacterium leontopitheci]|uniref:Serralysin n=1 Tax=Bifidobacterium leontopitheci TaxID=2650774 RepID=A0A6I1GNS7_9BIFI|nr:polyprenyl synthetase family protein [Bifidobacterium leontopitheci]KAB7791196.1 serralysin [Bifidobacterium leontopitheci]